mmetsp:Transcript_5304/g.8444  ORF Transcript_5304/g.8444 Transcript_5304/m.8444 type:complete len:203 (+) Transcript_5304:1362-1970(+)
MPGGCVMFLACTTCAARAGRLPFRYRLIACAQSPSCSFMAAARASCPDSSSIFRCPCRSAPASGWLACSATRMASSNRCSSWYMATASSTFPWASRTPSACCASPSSRATRARTDQWSAPSPSDRASLFMRCRYRARPTSPSAAAHLWATAQASARWAAWPNLAHMASASGVSSIASRISIAPFRSLSSRAPPNWMSPSSSR